MRRLATVLGCTAMVASASAPPGVAATRTVRVITHNIAGATTFHGELAAVDAAVRQAHLWQPDVVMLEEVCEAQARAFRDRVPGYHYVFTTMRPHNKDCGTSGPHFGHVLASRWSLSGVTRTNLHGDQHRRPKEAIRYFRLTCALVAAPGVPAGKLRACVTHLRARHRPAEPWLDDARAEQVHRIRRALHDDIVRRHVRVVVAGDFNARPQNRALDEIYRLQRGGGFFGAGDFFEADQTDPRYFPASGCVPPSCRGGEHTAGTTLDRKYDYVFFSALGVSGLSGRALELGGSDHKLFRGKARFQF
jgi:endonuclease/exonuclease/phosphatase family metal-dependent hydrolase